MLLWLLYVVLYISLVCFFGVQEFGSTFDVGFSFITLFIFSY